VERGCNVDWLVLCEVESYYCYYFVREMELLDIDHRVGIEPDTALNAGEDRDVNLELSRILPLYGEVVDVWIVSNIVGQVAYRRLRGLIYIVLNLALPR
jgi:hypothetical protein